MKKNILARYQACVFYNNSEQVLDFRFFDTLKEAKSFSKFLLKNNKNTFALINKLDKQTQSYETISKLSA